jgi:integrase
MAAPFLIKRRAGWYLRIRIPADLAPLLGSHLTRTLETRDYGLARRRAILAAARLQACWQETWRTMDRETYESIVENLRRRDRLRLQAELQRFDTALKTELKAEMDTAVRSWEALGPQPAPQAGEARPLPEEERLRAKLEGMQEALSMMAPAPPASATPPPLEAGTPASGLRPEAEKAWPDLVDTFFTARPSIGERARVSHRQAFREWEELSGRKAIGIITQADVARYVEWLEGRTNARAGRTALSRDTIVKKLQHIRGFLAWAEQRAFLATNPGAKVQPRPKTREESAGDGARRAFNNEELRKLFDSPLFTGCTGPRRRSIPGRQVLRDEKYWIFPVALLTGARIEELAEAPTALVDLEGIPCLDLRQSGTKTKAAPRLVPILPVLQKMGFVEWAATKAAKGGKLFQGGDASGDWSKWCNRYLDDVGLDDLDLTFHSLRHCFRQMLRAARIGDELADKIFGHEDGAEKSGGNRTGQRYGRDLSPQEARAVVECVSCPIALVHLHFSAAVLPSGC